MGPSSDLTSDLFLGALERFEIAGLVVALFSTCLLTLIASLVSFIQEINQSLTALRIELFGAPRTGPPAERAP